MINWKVRFKNKYFVITFLSGILLLIKQIATMFGYDLHIDNLSANLKDVIETLFTLLGMVGLTGIVTDPTTHGFSDSNQAMGYDKPNKDLR